MDFRQDEVATFRNKHKQGNRGNTGGTEESDAFGGTGAK
jgi:hypothetical protein